MPGQTVKHSVVNFKSKGDVLRNAFIMCNGFSILWILVAVIVA